MAPSDKCHLPLHIASEKRSVPERLRKYYGLQTKLLWQTFGHAPVPAAKEDKVSAHLKASSELTS